MSPNRHGTLTRKSAQTCRSASFVGSPLFRQTNKELARRGLDFLDLDPRDPELLEMVTTRLSPLDESEVVQAQRAGECLVRDLFGRIGAMRVQMPLDPDLADVIHSDPEQARAEEGPGGEELIADGMEAVTA
ncbi:ATP-binding protein [Streptomyces sp. NPDC048527]|uniref:ATP-binding protein n=1 Tax=Streptomyces sp. NPDC048527 TaxID=3365568 RepID=UPI00371201DC